MKAKDLSHSEMRRYGRHLVLPGFGMEHQIKLKQARVLVVGAGGLGAPALLYLAASGIGTLGIIDDDVVDESNLQRQILYSSAAIGAKKVLEARKRIQDLNPHVSVEVFDTRLTAANAESIIGEFDLIIDGSDNFATRYLVNDACVVLDKPFISGSILRFEGQLSFFNQHFENGRGPTYRCLFPAPPPLESVPNCAQAGVIGALAGIIGSYQALEAVKFLTGVGSTLSGRLLCFDGLTGSVSYLNFSRDERLAQATRILDETAYAPSCGKEFMSKVREIDVKELDRKLKAKEDICLIDVREQFERDIASLGGELIPMGSLVANVDRVPRDKEVIIYCRVGGRSHHAVQLLQDKFGFTNLYNLKGGVADWADQIDSTMKKY